MKGNEMRSFALFASQVLPYSSNLKSPRVLLTSRCFVLSLFVALAFECSVKAQNPNATATFSDTQVGPNYNYTITLKNVGTTPIETFWFAWVPGQDYLPTSPIGTVQAPSGWSGNVTHFGSADGYGIDYATTTTPLAVGNSTTFQFVSADSPAALEANSPFYPTVPVGTSTIYSGAAFGSPSQSFVVQAVPEPSSLALLLLAACLWPIANGSWRARGY
jgi:hypothetical protein